jgi:UDP-N-acetylmuramoylalanine-D-glutamate ligase
MEGYAAAKARLFERMDDELAILPVGSPLLVDASARYRGTRAWLGAHPGVVRDGKSVRIRLPAVEADLSLEGFAIPGAHNLDNAATAALLAIGFGADPAKVQAALPGLQPLAHRMQVVADVGGVWWIDDSKATNLDAAQVGIGGLDRRAVVLLGGQGKPFPDGSLGFGALADALRRHRAVVTFGQDGPKIADELAAVGIVSERVGGLHDAVRLAGGIAREGEAVLLSPGCASFDEFRDFEDRGEKFAAWVREERR